MAYIKCQNLSVGYAGETLIENINFEVHEQEKQSKEAGREVY